MLPPPFCLFVPHTLVSNKPGVCVKVLSLEPSSCRLQDDMAQLADCALPTELRVRKQGARMQEWNLLPPWLSRAFCLCWSSPGWIWWTSLQQSGSLSYLSWHLLQSRWLRFLVSQGITLEVSQYSVTARKPKQDPVTQRERPLVPPGVFLWT